MSAYDCRFCHGLKQYRQMLEEAASSSGTAGLVVADLPASIAVLSPDQYYRGYTIVMAKTHATELFHLPDPESTQFVHDMREVAEAVATAFSPRKMNYELLGNTVPHLHWHVVPRYDWDRNPTRPIWEHSHDPVFLATEEYEEIAARISAQLRR